LKYSSKRFGEKGEIIKREELYDKELLNLCSSLDIRYDQTKVDEMS
jgi:hypothetical protein